MLGEAVHKDTAMHVLPKVQTRGGGVKKIKHLFIVYLQEGALAEVLHKVPVLGRAKEENSYVRRRGKGEEGSVEDTDKLIVYIRTYIHIASSETGEVVASRYTQSSPSESRG